MINMIPMAGRGDRFFQNKYNVPKPLIPTMGSPMFISAIKSFPPADRFIFLCLAEHLQKYRLKSVIENNFNNFNIVSVDEVTEGQACTCLLADKHLDSSDPLFISSCDYQTIYDKEKYESLLNDESVDVIIWTFKIGSIKKSNPEAFAYCRVEGERVVEVVEKKAISNDPYSDPAVVGSFTYKNTELFLYGARTMIERNIRVNGEFYVGTSINQLIEAGHKVVTFEVDKFISFGNPFEFMNIQYWEEYFDGLENQTYSLPGQSR